MMNTEMTFGFIQDEDKRVLKEMREKHQREMLAALQDELANSEERASLGINFLDVSIDFERYKKEEAGLVRYIFELDDGYTQEDSVWWSWDVSIGEKAGAIVKSVAYIKKLREQYPLYARANDFIQSHRNYERSINLFHRGVIHPAKVSANLCEYLKLPNQTSCSIGGGDYEIKRTPGRLEDYNNNIDRLCLFLADCIAELRSMKWADTETEEGK